MPPPYCLSACSLSVRPSSPRSPSRNRLPATICLSPAHRSPAPRSPHYICSPVPSPIPQYCTSLLVARSLARGPSALLCRDTSIHRNYIVRPAAALGNATPAAVLPWHCARSAPPPPRPLASPILFRGAARFGPAKVGQCVRDTPPAPVWIRIGHPHARERGQRGSAARRRTLNTAFPSFLDPGRRLPLTYPAGARAPCSTDWDAAADVARSVPGVARCH